MADHDHAYKLLFSHAEMVADLLRGFVHEDWVGDLDFSTLEKVDASFISDGLQAREGDLLWRLRWGKDRWLYVYLLLEFQSTVDPFMAVRVMTYLGLLYQKLIREKLLTPEGRLPPVLSLVLYNGIPAWGAAQDVADLVEPGPGGLDRYQPRCRYLLLDEGRLADSELASLRNLAAALFRLEKSRGPEEVQRVVAALLEWLRGPDQAELRRAFGTWLSQVLLPARLPGVTVPGVMDLKEVKSMLAERVMEWTRQWEQEGFEKGHQKGRQEGRREGRREGRQEGHREGRQEEREKDLEEARSALVEAIEQRFGPVPEVIRQRIAAMSSVREIVLATARAATAPSLDALGIV